jgi:hypothetical protein
MRLREDLAAHWVVEVKVRREVVKDGGGIRRTPILGGILKRILSMEQHKVAQQTSTTHSSQSKT